MKLTEAQYEVAGQRIVGMLFLKPFATKTRVGEQVLYATDWGTKTAAGLAKCIERIMDEAGAAHVVPTVAEKESNAMAEAWARGAV